MTEYRTNRSTRLIAVIMVCVIIVMLPATCALLVFRGPYTTTMPRTFNSERWKEADAWGDARCGMIADLKYRVGIVGRTRSELFDMLGKPEGEDSDTTLSHWHLCPSFMDIFILEVRWRGDKAEAAWVRDT